MSGADRAVRIEVVPGGPLLVSGGPPLVRLERVPGGSGWRAGRLLEAGGSYAVCRCSASSRLPLCDREPPYGCFEEQERSGLHPAPFRWDVPDPAGPPMLALKPSGPLRVAGGVPILDPDGDVVDPGRRVSLCRCGASRSQPFCDGSHKVVGFRDE